jgi:predicted transcriptional regulator
MTTIKVTIDSTDSFRRRVKAAFEGKRQDDQISFESLELLWKVLLTCSRIFSPVEA